MGWNFTAIDFETANHQRGSPCAVGLARVRDGDVVDAVTWLMRPPAQYSGFEPYQVSVHGISSHRVASEPTFAEVLPRIIDYVGADTVVAHNARFDGAVIAAASIAVEQHRRRGGWCALSPQQSDACSSARTAFRSSLALSA